MSKTNKNSKQTQTKKKGNVGHKGAIIGLSIALALAGGAAATTTALYMVNQKSGGGSGPAIQQWTVSFVVEGHEITVQSQKINNNEHATRPNVDDWTENSVKYHIEGWTLNGETFNFTNTPITADTTLTAVVKEVQDPTVVTHIVTFDTAGAPSSVPAQEVNDGKYATRPQDPAYDSKHAFRYWTLDGVEYNFETAPVIKDIKLVAVWDDVPETSTTVTFNVDKTEGHFASGAWTVQQPIVIGGTLFNDCTIPMVTPENEYEFDCWVDKDGTPVGNIQINTPTQIYAKMNHIEQKVSIKLTTEYADLSAFGIVAEISINGDSAYNNIAPGTDYDTIKESLSKATMIMNDGDSITNIPFLYWSKTKPVLDITDPEFKGLFPAEATGELTDKETILYPVFDVMSGTVSSSYQLTVKAQDGQTIQGSPIVLAPYSEPMMGGEITYSKFGSLTKPMVTESGKVYEGYYKDQSCTQKWDSEEDVANDGEIWVKMVTPVTNFTVTFEDPDNEDTYTWDGNKDVLCKYDSEKPVILSNIAPSVYKNATPNPNPAVGYDTNWYFDGWMDKKTGKMVDANLEITEPITLVPTFKPKIELVFEIDDAGTTKTVYAAPTAKWSSVVLPQITTSKTGVWFTGWKTFFKGSHSEEGSTISDNNTIDEIQLSGSTSAIGGDQTVHIVPDFETNCHEFTFDANALIDDGSEEEHTTTVTFKETLADVPTGAPISTGENPRITYINSINRPAIPYETNPTISFNNEWQIKGGTFGATYQTITSETNIPEDVVTAETYTLRPIVKQRTTVKFSIDTEISEIKPWKESEVLSEITIEPDSPFAKIYHPTVVMKSAYADEKVFSHWSLKQNGDPIDSSYVFPEGQTTTLYAVYADKDVASTIHFHFSSNDLENEDFPITNPMPVDPYLKEDNTFAVSQIRAQGEEFDPKFSTFAQYPAQRYLSTLLGWSTKDNGTEEDLIDPDTFTVPAGKPINLYAVFKTNANYVKVTIDTTEQTIPFVLTGKDHFFVEQGTKSIVEGLNPGSILSKYEVGVKAVGYKSSKWVQSDGSDLPEKIDTPISIKPQFIEANSTILFSQNGDDTITLSTEQNIKKLPLNAKLSDYIDLESWTVLPAHKDDFILPTASKPKCQLKKWELLKDGKLEDITNDTEIDSDSITLVPIFETTPGFDVGTEAFFFDGSKGQYAAIKSYNNSSFNVMYEDKTTGTVDKANFNAEIKFGAGMTSIPDNFMAGCVNWNNGYTGTGLAKPLTLPSGIESIGDNFLANCYSFNQPIIAKIKHYETISESQHYGTGTYAFKIGQNFMRNCISFSKYVDLSYDGMTPPMPNYTLYLDVGQGFMYECQSFGTNIDGSCYIDFTGWSEIRDTTQLVPNKAETFYWSLSSSNPNSTIATKGITMYISADAEATFADRWIKLNDLAAESGVIPYRGEVIINK